MTYRFALDLDRRRYDDFVTASKYGTLLQSYAWADIKKDWDHLHTGVVDENNQVAAAGLVLIHKLPLGQTYFYLPRGPVMDFDNEELVKFYFTSLKEVARKRHCVMIKFDPAIHVNDYKVKDHNENRYPESEKYLAMFKDLGAVHYGYTVYLEETAQPRFVANVYKTENPEKELSKNTKRNIKVAEKHHVRVEMGRLEFLDDFSKMIEMTEERQKINLRDKDYFRRIMETYGDDAAIFLAKVNAYQLYHEAADHLNELRQKKAEMDASPEGSNKEKRLKQLKEQLSSAEKEEAEFKDLLEKTGGKDEDTPIAGAMVVKYGRTCENLYAGTDLRFKKLRAQYKTWFENIKWSFEQGCEWNDLGGIEGTLDDGLTKFKENFNPTINEFIGEFDLPVNKVLYPLVSRAYHHIKEKNAKEMMANEKKEDA